MKNAEAATSSHRAGGRERGGVVVAMSISAPILSANFPHVYGGRPRGRFSNLRFGATLTLKLIAGF